MKFFENLNFISNIFREPCDFLIFTGPVTIYISLRSSQPKVPRKKTKTVVLMIRGTFILKITKMGFGILINLLLGTLLYGFLLPGRHFLFLLSSYQNKRNKRLTVIELRNKNKQNVISYISCEEISKQLQFT